MKKVSAALAVLAVMSVGVLMATASAAPPKAQLQTHTTKLGTFLVDRGGHALYLFEADKTSKSTCTGACAKAWPPVLTTARATAASGVKAALIGTTKRPDGSTQVTYKGHPLYTFVKDSRAGTTKGEGSKAFGAGWYVVRPTGKKIDNDDDR